MRDPDRIEPLLKRLAAVWKDQSDLRLGQLMQNVPVKTLYSVEDDELIDAMEDFYGQWPTVRGQPSAQRVKSVFFFPNGNMAVCDARGEQMPRLQISWFLRMLDWLRQRAEIPEDCEIRMPDGSRVMPFKTESGWNWKLKRD